MGKWICGLDEEFEKLLDAKLAIDQYAFDHKASAQITQEGKIKDGNKLKLYATIDGNDDIYEYINYIERFKETIQDKEDEEIIYDKEDGIEKSNAAKD